MAVTGAGDVDDVAFPSTASRVGIRHPMYQMPMAPAASTVVWATG